MGRRDTYTAESHHKFVQSITPQIIIEKSHFDGKQVDNHL